MALTNPSTKAVLFMFTISAFVTTPASAGLFSLEASGTISLNSSGDPTIPSGTPWSLQLVYRTTAPDLDFELTTSPDPTFGRFKNTAAPPAMTFFHYKAGSYEVTLNDASYFGAFSDILITFTVVNAIDINIQAPTLFPHLAGGPVSFHADFNAFSTAPIFTSDALPTNTALGPASFDESTVTLLPPAGVVSSSIVTSLTLTAVPASADFDNSGSVDANDLTRWKSGFGAGGSHTQGDADGDGDVDGGDFLIWQRQLGGPPPAVVSATATPEPSGTVLMALAAMCLWRRALVKVSMRGASGLQASTELAAVFLHSGAASGDEVSGRSRQRQGA
jgi:hypothetical protein